MVAAFLQAEIDSPRFGGDVRDAMSALGVPEDVVRRPDLRDPEANRARAAVLARWRGYGRDAEMFEGVPVDLIWFEVRMSRLEVGGLRYVDDGYWNELSGGSRLVRDGAATVRSGRVVFGVPNDRFTHLAARIASAGYAAGPLIAWGDVLSGPLELIEGHLRATAIALLVDPVQEEIPAIVGLRSVPDSL